MIDWADPKRTDVIHFQMVDPNNLDEVYGDIEDVQLGTSPVTYGYYADTRYGSKITFLKDNNYVENTWIRIVHEIPSEGYVRELGTFVPTSPVVEYGGADRISLTLQSPLWALANNLTSGAFSIGKGTSVLNAFKRVCEACNRPYLVSGANDAIIKNAVAYEAGESYLTILFDLASSSGNRVDVDGHGRITLGPVLEMGAISPSWELDVDDPRSMIIQESVKMEPEVSEIPNRVIVIGKSHVGVADLPAGSRHSAAQRGFVLAEAISDKTVTTKAAAKEMAQFYLGLYGDVKQWTMKTLYFPAQCGDIVKFHIDGGIYYCLIKSIDPIDLATMTMDITLEEVFYG